MKKCFKLIFSVFFFSGMTTLGLIGVAGINELLVKYCGSVWTIPPYITEIIAQVFRALCILTLVSLPAIVVKVFVAMFQTEATNTKSLIGISLLTTAFALMLVVGPVILLLAQNHNMDALMWSALWVIGGYFGKGGEQYTVPKFLDK